MSSNIVDLYYVEANEAFYQWDSIQHAWNIWREARHYEKVTA